MELKPLSRYRRTYLECCSEVSWMSMLNCSGRFKLGHGRRPQQYISSEWDGNRTSPKGNLPIVRNVMLGIGRKAVANAGDVATPSQRVN